MQSPSCKEGNEVSSKLGAQVILRGILGLEIEPENIVLQFEGHRGFDTVIEASTVRAIDGVQVETDIVTQGHV